MANILLQLLEGAGNFLVPQTTRQYKAAFSMFDKNKSDEEKLKAFQQTQDKGEQAKMFAELASFLVPFGKGANLVTRALLPGAGMGALRGMSKDDASVGSVLTDATTGAATAGILDKVLGVGGAVKDAVVKKAQQSFTRATPSMWQKAVEEHGIDVNKLASKYIPKGVKNLDDLVGAVEQRGREGIIGQYLDDAERLIQQTARGAGKGIKIYGDDVIKQLQKERSSLAQTLGNESKIKALDNIIKEATKKYSKGMSAEQALSILRSANKKFGKSIVETSGDAVATAAQKIEANTLRNILKKQFPAIKNALDTQSELLTLRPLLNRARSVAGTMGSEIRSGQLSNLNLLNPLSYGKTIDAAFSQSPKIASQFLQQSQPNQLLNQILTKGGVSVATEVSDRMANPQMSEQQMQQTQQMQPEQSQAVGKLEQKLNDIQSLFEQANQNEVATGMPFSEEALFKVLVSPDVDADIKNVLLTYYKLRMDNKEEDSKLTSQQQKRKNALDQVESTLGMVENLALDAPEGVGGFLGAALGSFPGVEGGSAEDLKRVTEGLAKSIAGALANEVGVATDRDIERWMGLMPKVGDTMAERKRAIQRIKDNLKQSRKQLLDN